MKYGSTVKFKDIPAGHLLYGGGVLWELVESCKVGSSYAPTMPVMVARWIHPEQKSYKIGQSSIDYFNEDFTYVGIAENLEKSIQIFKNAFES